MEPAVERGARHSLHGLGPERTVTLSAHDVAEELRTLLPHIGRVQLHKLLYYAQGLHVTWTDEPLFSEEIEAWAMGPVVGSLWADERHGRARPAPRPLSGDQRELVAEVVDRFGDLTGTELIRRTHLEDPWRDASEADSDEQSPTIALAALRDWFSRSDEFRHHLDEADRLRANRSVYSFDWAQPDGAGDVGAG